MKPLPLKTQEVQSISGGTKTQFRRIVKQEEIQQYPNRFKYEGNSNDFDIPRMAKKYDNSTLYSFTLVNNNGPQWVLKCPFGEIGTVLWCRETWQWEGMTKYTDASPIGGFYYLADADQYGPHKWRPSIHMPREACRLFLRITDISVERLNDISEEDAIAEGVEYYYGGPFSIDYRTSGKQLNWVGNATASFITLWESINGKGSWEVNPWIWKLNFERIDKPENW